MLPFLYRAPFKSRKSGLFQVGIEICLAFAAVLANPSPIKDTPVPAASPTPIVNAPHDATSTTPLVTISAPPAIISAMPRRYPPRPGLLFSYSCFFDLPEEIFDLSNNASRALIAAEFVFSSAIQSFFPFLAACSFLKSSSPITFLK